MRASDVIHFISVLRKTQKKALSNFSLIVSFPSALALSSVFSPFRSYVGPRPTRFSSSAPMSEDVRHGFNCICSSAVGACPTLFLMQYGL
jgi:hypothetical protein